MRVLARFRVNLAIPEGEYGYLSCRGKGYLHRRAMYIVLVREGESR